MPSISIEFTSEEHNKIKVMAESQGKSINEFVKECCLVEHQTEEEALQQLKEFLKPRIGEAERGEYSNQTIEQIKQAALASLTS